MDATYYINQVPYKPVEIAADIEAAESTDEACDLYLAARTAIREAGDYVPPVILDAMESRLRDGESREAACLVFTR